MGKNGRCSEEGAQSNQERLYIYMRFSSVSFKKHQFTTKVTSRHFTHPIKSVNGVERTGKRGQQAPQHQARYQSASQAAEAQEEEQPSASQKVDGSTPGSPDAEPNIGHRCVHRCVVEENEPCGLSALTAFEWSDRLVHLPGTDVEIHG